VITVVYEEYLKEREKGRVMGKHDILRQIDKEIKEMKEEIWRVDTKVQRCESMISALEQRLNDMKNANESV